METNKSVDFTGMTSSQIAEFVKQANKELSLRQKNFKACSSLTKAILAGEPESIDGVPAEPIIPVKQKEFTEKIGSIAVDEQKTLWQAVLAAQIKAGIETPITFAQFLTGAFAPEVKTEAKEVAKKTSK